MIDYPKTRKEAKEQGAKYYFTGKPCKHGHVALRVTKGACVECRKIEWALENKRRSQLPKSEASKAAGRRYYEKNKKDVIQRALQRSKEDQRKYKNRYDKKNPEKKKLATNMYRKRLRDASPSWLTKQHKQEIRAIYKKALEWTEKYGQEYSVDHIVPLRGRLCSGLHVPWNLQLLTRVENSSKGNTIL